MEQATVTLTYERGGTTILRMVGLASGELSYVAPVPVIIADDEFGTELWAGFRLTNHTTREEKRPF